MSLIKGRDLGWVNQMETNQMIFEDKKGATTTTHFKSGIDLFTLSQTFSLTFSIPACVTLLLRKINK